MRSKRGEPETARSCFQPGTGRGEWRAGFAAPAGNDATWSLASEPMSSLALLRQPESTSRTYAPTKVAPGGRHFTASTRTGRPARSSPWCGRGTGRPARSSPWCGRGGRGSPGAAGQRVLAGLPGCARGVASRKPQGGVSSRRLQDENRVRRSLRRLVTTRHGVWPASRWVRWHGCVTMSRLRVLTLRRKLIMGRDTSQRRREPFGSLGALLGAGRRELSLVRGGGLRFPPWCGAGCAPA